MSSTGSATSSTSSSTSSSNMIRITGMASGLDTDSLVKQMMQPYQAQMDKLSQQKQLTQWKQDAYRDMLSTFSTFKSSYFDVLNSSSYMLSTNAYAGFNVSTSNTVSGAQPSVSVTANTGAVVGGYSVTVNNLAKTATVSSTASLAATVTAGSNLTDLDATLNGTINLNLSYNNNGTEVQKLVTLDNSSGTKSINDLISQISAATSGAVTAKFSDLTHTFSIQTQNTGASTDLSITAGAAPNATTNALLTGLKLDSSGAVVNGKDASVTITPPGGVATTVTKPKNTFNIDNITYSLISDTAGQNTTNVSIASDTTAVFNKVKDFVSKYNDMIDKINTKLQEKKNADYKPLTDSQRSSMTTDQITQWETKAKQGILGNDNYLNGMVTAMRSAFYDTVQGAGITLTSIGLSTSSDITQGGKIIIDDTKLKDAIANNGTQVANLFMQASKSQPLYNPDMSQTARNTRNSEEGIFQRINDIMQDYSRTTRNSAGKKGSIIEVAGIQGDYTQYNNLLTTQLNQQTKAISDFQTKMSDKQTQFYNQFSKLESAMSTLNQQSSWITQQLGG